MIATATHDTKRGEDARARLLALSEMPDDWAARARRLRCARPRRSRRDRRRGRAPGRERPLHAAAGAARRLAARASRRGDDGDALDDFRDAHRGFAAKALREAKRHTSWVNVDEAYEEAPQRLRRARCWRPARPFLDAFRPLARRLAYARHAQRARPDRAEMHAAGRARHLSGHRALGPVAGRSRQPPPGRLRRARAPRSRTAAILPALLRELAATGASSSGPRAPARRPGRGAAALCARATTSRSRRGERRRSTSSPSARRSAART